MTLNALSRLLKLLLIPSLLIDPSLAGAWVPLRPGANTNSFVVQALIPGLVNVRRPFGAIDVRQAMSETAVASREGSFFNRRSHQKIIALWSSVRNGFTVAAGLSWLSTLYFTVEGYDAAILLAKTCAAAAVAVETIRWIMSRDATLAGDFLSAETAVGGRTHWRFGDLENAPHDMRVASVPQIMQAFFESHPPRRVFEQRLMALVRLTYEEDRHRRTTNEMVAKTLAIPAAFLWRLRRWRWGRSALEDGLRDRLEASTSGSLTFQVLADDEYAQDEEDDTYFSQSHPDVLLDRLIKKTFEDQQRQNAFWYKKVPSALALVGVFALAGWLMPLTVDRSSTPVELTEAAPVQRSGFEVLRVEKDMGYQFTGLLRRGASRGAFVVIVQRLSTDTQRGTALDGKALTLMPTQVANVKTLQIEGQAVNLDEGSDIRIAHAEHTAGGQLLLDIVVTPDVPNQPFSLRYQRPSVTRPSADPEETVIVMTMLGTLALILWCVQGWFNRLVAFGPRVRERWRAYRDLHRFTWNRNVREEFERLKQSTIRRQVQVIYRSPLASRAPVPGSPGHFGAATVEWEANANRLRPYSLVSIILNPLETDPQLRHDVFVHEVIGLNGIAALLRETLYFQKTGIDLLIASGMSDLMTYSVVIRRGRSLGISRLDRLSAAYNLFTHARLVQTNLFDFHSGLAYARSFIKGGLLPLIVYPNRVLKYLEAHPALEAKIREISDRLDLQRASVSSVRWTDLLSTDEQNFILSSAEDAVAGWPDLKKGGAGDESVSYSSYPNTVAYAKKAFIGSAVTAGMIGVFGPLMRTPDGLWTIPATLLGFGILAWHHAQNIRQTGHWMMAVTARRATHWHLAFDRLPAWSRVLVRAEEFWHRLPGSWARHEGLAITFGILASPFAILFPSARRHEVDLEARAAA